MKRSAVAVVVFSTIAAVVQSTHAAITFQTAALFGQSAPGAGAGATFSHFQFPAINDAGVVTFAGQAKLSNNNVRDGIWAGTVGSLQLVAFQDIQPPGTPNGARFQNFIYPSAITSSNQVAFEAGLTGNGSNNSGVWAGSAGALQLVALAGAQAAELASGITYRYLNQFTAIGAAGNVVFSGGLQGPGVVAFQNDTAVWAGNPAAPQLVLRAGSAAPGTAAGVVFAEPGGSYHPGINAPGQVVVKAALTGTGVTTANDLGIWVGQPDALQLAAREGSPAPGTGAGVVFNDFSYQPYLLQGLNAASQISFRALLTGTGVVSTNRAGVWAGAPGSVALVARQGSTAPGLGAGVLFGDMLTDPMINGPGKVIFQSGLTGAGVVESNNAALWAGTPGNVSVVARRGMIAPGTTGSVIFDSSSGVTTPFSSEVLSATGQVAFMSTLEGTGVNSANRDGIWAKDPLGNLQLIARTGQLFDVGIGNLRTIQSLSLTPFELSSAGQDGRASVFNSSGQLVFFAEFTDFSSGIFIANVPEPNSVFLATSAGLVAVIGLVWGRKSQKSERM